MSLPQALRMPISLALIIVIMVAPAEASGVFTDKAGLQAAVNDVATAENTHGPLAW